MVSMVWARARKCQAGRPKKSRRSTTESSMVAAFTENFDQMTRKERCSPVSNGTTTLGSAFLSAGLGAGRAGRLVWPGEAKHAPRKRTKRIAESAAVTIDF